MKIALATPSRDGMVWMRSAQAAAYFAHECSAKGVGFDWLAFYNDPYIDQARDALVMRFLAGDGTHLLFLDSDVEFVPSDIWALSMAGEKIIAGVYSRKKINFKLVHQMAQVYSDPLMLDHTSCEPLAFLSREIETHRITGEQFTKPLEVACAATGFLMIQRNVLEQYREECPNRYNNTRYEMKDITPWFKHGIDPETNEAVGEDVQFCMNMKKMGVSTYVLPYLSLGHVGPHVHHGCFGCATGQPIHGIHSGAGNVRA
jgi:hypothetical protein